MLLWIWPLCLCLHNESKCSYWTTTCNFFGNLLYPIFWRLVSWFYLDRWICDENCECLVLKAVKALIKTISVSDMDMLIVNEVYWQRDLWVPCLEFNKLFLSLQLLRTSLILAVIVHNWASNSSTVLLLLVMVLHQAKSEATDGPM